MQQQELAQIRHREANLTALAAIGPRKKRKTDSPVRGAGAEVVGRGSGGNCLTAFVHISQQGFSDIFAPLKLNNGRLNSSCLLAVL